MKIDLGKKNLTTPKAILFGLGLIALAIASVPYSSQIIKPAFANSDSDIQKVMICGYYKKELGCAGVFNNKLEIFTISNTYAFK